MKVKFYSEDGKVFDSKKECLEYEEKLIAKKEAEKKKAEEQETRRKEVEDAYNYYAKKLNEYLNDYGNYTKRFLDNEGDDYPVISALLKAFDLV